MIKEIKHAVNSSVGTQFFKSLSETIKPEEVIFSASGNTMNYLSVSPYVYYYNLSSSKEKNLIKKFKSFGRGNIEISCFAYGNAHLIIFQNGQVVHNQESTIVVKKVLDISYGDEIEIVATNVSSVHIKADQIIIYNNIIEK